MEEKERAIASGNRGGKEEMRSSRNRHPSLRQELRYNMMTVQHRGCHSAQMLWKSGEEPDVFDMSLREFCKYDYDEKTTVEKNFQMPCMQRPGGAP
jgi:hypothetical protein